MADPLSNAVPSNDLTDNSRKMCNVLCGLENNAKGLSSVGNEETFFREPFSTKIRRIPVIDKIVQNC